VKKEEPAGYIFLCSDATEEECLERPLFGGTEKYVKRVTGLKKGHKLFLYNYSTKTLHGIFEAESEVQSNIVSKAWGGEYPLQVKVKRIGSYKPISRDEIPKGLLGFDMTGKPTSRLSAEKVGALEAIFKSKKRVRVYDNINRYLTEDGHKVKSKPEQQIDNWLYKNGIAHGYETPIPGAKRCDFEIPSSKGKIYIEYWGLNDAQYLANKKTKLKLYKKNKLQLINVYLKDLKKLDVVLRKLLT
jgi:hypothetical protein